MIKLRHLSIEHKLNLIVLAAIIAAMTIASTAMINRYAKAARLQHIEDLTTLGEIIGNNSKAALSFSDPEDARETLAALVHKPIILAAELYQRDGAGFARYAGEGILMESPEFPPLPDLPRPLIRGNVLTKSTVIYQNNEKIGTLVMHADLYPIHAAIRDQILFAVLITLGSVLVAVLLASRIQHFILRHIRRVVDMANAIALGDLPEHIQVTSEDEIGELERAFNEIVDASRGLVKQTQTLAKGNYAISIQPRSDRDELSHALIAMTRALNDFNEESRQQSWLRNSLGDLNDRIRGEQSLDVLLKNVLDCITAQVDAQAGLIYLRTDARTLRLASAYAADVNIAEAPGIPFGRGLVGQAAEDRGMKILSDPTGRPLVLHTGLLDHALHHLALVPLVHDHTVAGVMELGRLGPFSPGHEELLRMAGPTIAIAMETARSRQMLNELLAETQRQSRELQQQQAALQNSNRELEQRNQLLENQKQEIHRQNNALEAARLDLERKARELEQASRYKSEFLANMSHELRTPLNSMLILSRLLADNKTGNLNDKQIDFAKTIHKSGSDLLTLINDILDLSKVEAGMLEMHQESVLVEDILNALAQIFRPLAAEKGIDFVVTREPGCPGRLLTDGKRVGQILRNLVGNAFKFTATGSVTVRAWKPAGEETAKGQVDGVAFSIVDTGIGIPLDKQDLIFRAFQQADGTTSRKYGGTGLGLSISRELALRLGGDIHLDSQPGRGSTFTLLLSEAAVDQNSPVTATPDDIRVNKPVPPPVVEPKNKDGPDPEHNTRRLLVIEDDAAFARVIAEIARERGYEPLLASHGDAGLEFARAHHPVGIILDMMLPGKDGHAILTELKKSNETRCIPVHIISALEQDQQLLREGAIGFITKPVSPAQINQALDRIEWVAQRHQKNLLVVDDDPKDLNEVSELLADWPIRAVRCSTGKEAIHIAKTTEIDGMLLDWGLQDMTGRQVLDAIEPWASGAYVPVILYTGRDLDRDEEAALRRRVVSVVVKGDQAPQRLLTKLAFYLHLEVPAHHAAPVARPPATEDSIKGKRILIVDDDMRNAFSLAAIAEAWGAEGLVAADGEKAIDMLEKDHEIDLVLMDIMMPGMDGYQAMREIRRRRTIRNVPIIALTAKAMKEDREACLAAGANDYLAKPVDMDQLLLLVKSWVRR